MFFQRNIPGDIVAKYPEHKWCKSNTVLWNSGIEANKEIVSKYRKRQTKYVANIYIVSDPKNTDNDGKVFLFTFGPKILEKIKSCSKPEFPDAVAFNPFDFWKGANFRLKIKNVAKLRNYDSSTFDAPSPLSNDDELLEKIWELEYPLTESFLGKAQYKTYEQLDKRFRDVTLEGSSSLESSQPQTIPSSVSSNRPIHMGEEEESVDASTQNNSQKYQNFLNKFKEDTDSEDDENPF